MEREIRVRFTGDARDMQRASEEARRALNTMGRDTAEFSRTATQSMQRVSESTGQAARNMAAELGRMAAAYASVGAAAALFWKGLSHNAELESLKLGMATIVSANETIKDSTGKQVEGAQKLAVAQGQVAEVFERMKLDAINTTATLPQLAQAFNAALAPSMAMGASLDETRKMTVAMVQAMGAMGIPLDQARQEINSILQAQISEDSQLAKNLGLNNEMVKSWKEQGKLVDNLLDRLKDFTVAGSAAGETWNGVTSTLADNMSNLLGVMTGDSFNTLKSSLSDLNKSFGTEGQSDAARWGAIINDSLTTAIQLAGGVGSVLLKGAKMFQDALSGIRVFGAQFGGAEERSNRINDLIANLPTRDQNPEGIQRVGKIPLLAAPFWTDNKTLAGMAQMGGLNGKALEKFKQDLAAIEQQVNDGISGQIDEIINGWEKGLKEATAAARRTAGKTISPKKPGSTPGKASKPVKSDLGPASVGQMYGPEQIVLPAPTYEARDIPGVTTGPDLEFEEWKVKKAEEGARKMASILNAFSDLASSPSIGSAFNAAGSIASMFGPQGQIASIGLGLFGSSIDRDIARSAAAGEAYRSGISGSLVDRSQFLAGATEANMGWFNQFREGKGQTGLARDIANFDQKALRGLLLQSDNTAEGARDRSLLSLEKEASDLKDKFHLTQETIDAYTTAKKAEIDKTYEASKAQEEFARRIGEVNKSIGIFGGQRGVAGLRESLGLGKASAGDVERALWMSDSGVSVGDISSAANQQTILSSLQDLLLVQAQGKGDYVMGQGGPMLTSLTGSANSAIQALLGAGLDVSGKSVAQIVQLLQGIVIPAMQDLKSITGGAATGSIGGAGSDNALAFDAPQTRMVTNNNAITVNTLAITGDKASVRELARVLAVEMNTITSQAV